MGVLKQIMELLENDNAEVNKLFEQYRNILINHYGPVIDLLKKAIESF